MSFGAMTALREGWSRGIRKCFLHARRAVWTSDPTGEPFEIEVDDRRRVKGQPLRDEQTADDCDTEWTPQLGPGALSKCDWHSAEQGGEGRHHDRPETQQASLVDRLARAFAFEPLRLEGEVDHHDRVLLDDTDQENDADHRDHAQIVMQQH